jgi:hypothetical protein
MSNGNFKTGYSPLVDEAMNEPPDARRVLTYLRALGAGKFTRPALAALLKVDKNVIVSITNNLEFGTFTDVDGNVWYMFNHDTFAIEPPDEAAALKAEIQRLESELELMKKSLEIADADHAETLDKYDQLRLYALAALEIASGNIFIFLKRGLGHYLAGPLMETLGHPPEESNDCEEIPF